jgi:hypothetical protein
MANIGFVGHDGFVLGADIGLLFPLGSTKVDLRDMSGKLRGNGVAQAQVDHSKDRDEDRVNKLLAQMPMFMQVNLIRLGYLF